MLNYFVWHNLTYQWKKITQWETDSDVIKKVGKGEITLSLFICKTIRTGFRLMLLTGLFPAVISFMTHPKKMSRQRLEPGLGLFLQYIRCQKWEQIPGLRSSSATFCVGNNPSYCSSISPCCAFIIQSFRALNMCRFVLALIQAMLPFKQIWALSIYIMEAVILIFQSFWVHI